MRDIDAFHEKFGLEAPNRPRMLDWDTTNFRHGFMQEELDEYMLACKDQRMDDAYDALVDLMYVVLGTMWMHGFPLDAGWEEVHACNMTKQRASSASESKRGSHLDVIKPPGFKPADMARILVRFGGVLHTGQT